MADQDDIRSRTLLVGRNQSKCGRCGLGADPRETTHDTVLAYSSEEQPPGCGVEWTHIAATYVNGDGSEEGEVKDMRPDLDYAYPGGVWW